MGLTDIISNIVKDTDSKVNKECAFCGKTLTMIDYGVLYANIKNQNEAEFYERCNCEKAIEVWQKYDNSIKEEKQREICKKQIDKLFVNNNLGKRQLNSTFEKFKINDKNKELFNNIKNYTNKLINGQTNKGLFITGEYGVGKTYMASCIANEMIKNNKTVIFGTMIQLLDFIKDTYKDSETTDKEYINLYSNVDLLIIDDLGKEKPTEWSLQQLFSIMNSRYNNYLPVIITTNYNRKQLRERLCVNKNYSVVDSIISRVYETSAGVEIRDVDHRKI